MDDEYTDRAKPLEQEPGLCRVLELYTVPVLAQAVWRDLYFCKKKGFEQKEMEV